MQRKLWKANLKLHEPYSILLWPNKLKNCHCLHKILNKYDGDDDDDSAQAIKLYDIVKERNEKKRSALHV